MLILDGVAVDPSAQGRVLHARTRHRTRTGTGTHQQPKHVDLCVCLCLKQDIQLSQTSTPFKRTEMNMKSVLTLCLSVMCCLCRSVMVVWWIRSRPRRGPPSNNSNAHCTSRHNHHMRHKHSLVIEIERDTRVFGYRSVDHEARWLVIEITRHKGGWELEEGRRLFLSRPHVWFVL